MPSTSYMVTSGIVLRETYTKESDKILTLLTPEKGKLAVIAKGARRKNCKYSAAAQPLVWSEWTLYHKGEWYYANDGGTLELFDGLRGDLEALSLGFYLAELTEALTAPDEPAQALTSHLLNGLYALGVLHKPPAFVKPAFELKLMSLAGYEPLVDACAYCGAVEPVQPRLDIAQGVLRCSSCGTEEHTVSRPLCGDSLAALRYIVYGDAKRLYAFTLGKEALARLSEAAESFLTTQLDRGFKTLDFYKSLG